MRKLILLLALMLLVGLFGCSKRHNDLIFEFPVLPIITSADLEGSDDHVHLTWTFADAASVDVYRIYSGYYINFGGGSYDSVWLVGSTQEQNFYHQNDDLGRPSIELCELANLCEPLYNYAQYRVTAVIGGVEGVASERAIPTP